MSEFTQETPDNLTIIEDSLSTEDPFSALPPVLTETHKKHRPSRGFWTTAFLKLLRNKTAMAAFLLFAVIVVICLLAPFYAQYVSHTNPFQSNLNGTVMINGVAQPVLQPATNALGIGVTPIGPTWHWGPYLLGSDMQGRDVAARLLYGGRVSLLVGAASMLICLVLAGISGIVAGFFGGIVDRVISIIFDILWAFPVYLLAISLSVVFISHGLQIGPFNISSNSLLMPIGIIGVVMVPYVARSVRGRTLALRKSEFVMAAECLGVPRYRILVRDILPNVMSVLITFAPLIMTLNILAVAALSYLSVGVQPPNASWGTIIHTGESLMYTRPMVAIAPGVAIALTALSLNIFGDGVAEAFDPRSKQR